MIRFIRTCLQSPKCGVVFTGLFLGFVLYFWFIRAPFSFPDNELITIKDGATIQEAARLLEEKNVVSSSAIIGILFRYFSDVGVRAGTYTFEQPLNVFSVWNRMRSGQNGTPLIRVTVPEGATTREMAELFARTIPGFDPVVFRELAGPKEGYLFPDTYIFAPGTSEETIIAVMERTFFEKIIDIQPDIDASGKTLQEVVVMASLLEKEARLYETMQIVAGILWKRIDIGMPLQVDAVFGYILDRDTFNPTFDILEIDSPYNTYQNVGLPPGAISNPGLKALRAAVNPIETPYFFYLTGADGTMHYARDFDQHVANRRFLR